jgi:hypothetical protein
MKPESSHSTRFETFSCAALQALLLSALTFTTASLQAESVFITTRGVEIPEAGFVTNTVLHTTRHELTFLPPRNWKENFDTNSLTFVWSSGDYTTELRLRIAAALNPAELKPDELREKIRRDFPQARLKEEFPCYTSTGRGLAFDLEESGPQGLVTATRMGFVPFEGGMLEFKLVTPADQLQQNHLLFGHFLNSFRAGPRSRK